ncbi:MAG: hypothetical protein OEY67_03795 [Gammaproteobacteria bacterium]|nr:hypothetical protein [Gammaproteobacteria bacterium]
MTINNINNNLASHRLTVETFPAFYRTIMALRFPIDVADVMELRDIINHSTDRFSLPPVTPDYRQFVNALQGAIDSFGIENKRHSERLIKVFTMFRHLHYRHSIRSRDKEFELRQLQSDNRLAYSRSMRYAMVSILAAVTGSMAWLSLTEPGWGLKGAVIFFSYLSLDYFHSLGTLERELKIITRELNAVLRERVNSLNWKTMIHKLSLILGFKRIEGINVFLMNNSADFGDAERMYH